jgi:hypothetical protein
MVLKLLSYASRQRGLLTYIDWQALPAPEIRNLIQAEPDGKAAGLPFTTTSTIGRAPLHPALKPVGDAVERKELRSDVGEDTGERDLAIRGDVDGHRHGTVGHGWQLDRLGRRVSCGESGDERCRTARDRALELDHVTVLAAGRGGSQGQEATAAVDIVPRLGH